MQPALKYLDDDNAAPLIHPEKLLAHLSKSFCNFETLLKDLNCKPDDLRQTLDDPQTSELLKLKTQLAAMQLKLMAIQYVPHAFAKQVELMHTSERPEVARRCSNTVMHIAGISTETKRAEPQPLPQPGPVTESQLPILSESQRDRVMATLEAGMSMKEFGVNPEELPHDVIENIIQVIAPILAAYREKNGIKPDNDDFPASEDPAVPGAANPSNLQPPAAPSSSNLEA